VAFVAIDFETASAGRESACAIGLVRVEGYEIVRRETRLIRPPSPDFTFTWCHGITWEDVVDQPPFYDVWRELSPMIEGAQFLAAHNAGFDAGVLKACCRASGHEIPVLPFECTVKIARKAWNIRPTRLDVVCKALDIPLRHHDAGSDAEACARILLAAAEEGIL
jgi:DNA polymerase-3 subunit epsilon